MPYNPKTGKHLPYTKANIAMAKKKGFPMKGDGEKKHSTRISSDDAQKAIKKGRKK